MRNRKLATASMEHLCKALQMECLFLFKIPNHTVYYRPLYSWPLGIRPGNFILFASANLSMDEVFLGQVKAVSIVGDNGAKRELVYLDVDCIKRPDGRGKRGMVNALNKVKIFETSIICLLQASRAIG